MSKLQNLILFLALTIYAPIFAQTGCPGCSINLPPLSADTIYSSPIPDGEQTVYYNQDVSFRLPKTTTPLAAIQPGTPSGLTIDKWEIVSISNLPAGLSWEANNNIIIPATNTDACIKICGTPLESDTFYLSFTVNVTVFGLVNAASFDLPFYVAPISSANAGFTMTNGVGCGNTTVTFENNLPSNGVAGYSYTWDFGNGNMSLNENPTAQTYNIPGLYPISYAAIIDTAGYTLSNVEVLDVDTDVNCNDIAIPFLTDGEPDLFIRIFDENNIQIFESPVFNDISLPVNFSTGIKFDGNYVIQVWDDDGGIDGANDLCGTINFNTVSNDTLTNGDCTVELSISHPVLNIFSTDTVIVNPIPAAPTLTVQNNGFCVGDSAMIISNYDMGNNWFLDNNPFQTANNNIIITPQIGNYSVIYTDFNGCSSEATFVQINATPLPTAPVYVNNSNLLVVNTNLLPTNYSLQWYKDNNELIGENSTEYCVVEFGTYKVVVTDLNTGCQNYFETTVPFNPSTPCDVATNDVDAETIKLFPNPTTNILYINNNHNIKYDNIKIYNISGEQLLECNEKTMIDVSMFDTGIYYIKFIQDSNIMNIQRFIKL